MDNIVDQPVDDLVPAWVLEVEALLERVGLHWEVEPVHEVSYYNSRNRGEGPWNVARVLQGGDLQSVATVDCDAPEYVEFAEKAPAMLARLIREVREQAAIIHDLREDRGLSGKYHQNTDMEELERWREVEAGRSYWIFSPANLNVNWAVRLYLNVPESVQSTGHGHSREEAIRQALNNWATAYGKDW